MLRGEEGARALRVRSDLREHKSRITALTTSWRRLSSEKRRERKRHVPGACETSGYNPKLFLALLQGYLELEVSTHFGVLRENYRRSATLLASGDNDGSELGGGSSGCMTEIAASTGARSAACNARGSLPAKAPFLYSSSRLVFIRRQRTNNKAAPAAPFNNILHRSTPLQRPSCSLLRPPFEVEWGQGQTHSKPKPKTKSACGLSHLHLRQLYLRSSLLLKL